MGYQHMITRCARHLILVGVLLAGAANAQADLVMKVLIVNPSETDVKEFDIRNPLPPEVKPEHVLDADGLKVDYDSQAGTYLLIGTVTLKAKESLTKRIVLEDVWVLAPGRLSGLRGEMEDILAKLEHTPYAERGELLGQAIARQLNDIAASQDQPFLNPQQHITQYREDMKRVQMVESDLTSLRQLMVMAALNPSEGSPLLPAAASTDSGSAQRDGLSVLTTWRLIFLILGLLGFVSVSFFVIWHRQLRLQLAKQAGQEQGQAVRPSLVSGNGKGTPPVGHTPAPSPSLRQPHD